MYCTHNHHLFTGDNLVYRKKISYYVWYYNNNNAISKKAEEKIQVTKER